MERTEQRESMRSPLPYCLAIVGAFVPLLVLEAMGRGGSMAEQRGLGVSVSALSALVSACVGVLLRDTRRWLAFVALGLAMGTAFGTFVALTFGEPHVRLGELFRFSPFVMAMAFACALPLVLVASGVFVAHRRLLGTRPGSLLAAVDGLAPWVATGFAVVAAGWSIDRLASPSLVRVALVGAAMVLVVVGAIARRRHVSRLLEAVDTAGDPVDDDPHVETVHDLGVGEERWLLVPARDVYRASARPSPVLRGSLGAARRRGRIARYKDALLVTLGLFAVMHVAVTRLLHVDEDEHIQAIEQWIPPEPGPPPIRTASWYPDADPLVVDIDEDGAEDVVTLRWDDGQPDRALFAAAHDGATLEPLWVTEPVPSQWMSPDTRLVRRGSVLFLTDSERTLRLYDLSTGRELHRPISVGGANVACLPSGDTAGIWLSRGYPEVLGTLVDASGNVSESEEPENCESIHRPRRGTLGAWDKTCSQKLRGKEAAAVTWSRRDDIGLGVAAHGEEPFVIGYEPDGCRIRWRSPIPFTDEPLHFRPGLSNQLAGDRLYSLYQLESGQWKVGARDARTGRLAWQRTLPQAERGTNVDELFVTDQRVYVGRDWRLDVLKIDDGEVLGRI